MATGQKGVKMFKVVYEPAPKGKEKETAKQNAEDYEALRQRIMNTLKSFSAMQDKQFRRNEMVTLGQLRRRYLNEEIVRILESIQISLDTLKKLLP